MLKKQVMRAHLNGVAFGRMMNKFKRMEFRLRRGKWRSLKAGDIIEFQNDDAPKVWLRVQVKRIVNYPDFPLLLQDFDPRIYTGKSYTAQLRGLRGYYSRQDCLEHTVLGIEVKVIEVFVLEPRRRGK